MKTESLIGLRDNKDPNTLNSELNIVSFPPKKIF